MRVLLVAPPWFPVPPTSYGGTEQIVALLADGLVAAGHEVTLAASGGSRTAARLASTFERPPTSLLGTAEIELAHVAAAYRLRHTADVIHDHTVLGLGPASVDGGPPVVHTVHGRWSDAAAPLYQGLEDRVQVVTLSHDHARRAPTGVRTQVVHNAVDMAAHPLVVEKGDHLAFLGRATPDKGPEVALEVARRTGRELRMAVKVNEADERAYFETVLRPALRRADVRLVDVADQAAKLELLGSAAVVLFPIRWDEPFGLVPLEAAACGTPVVAFARGAVPEVVRHGLTGLLVPPQDVEGMCEAVEPATALDARTCRAWVERRFDAPRMVADYVAVYERAMAALTPGGRGRRRAG